MKKRAILLVLVLAMILTSCSQDKSINIELPSGTYRVSLGDARYTYSQNELVVLATGSGEHRIDLSGLSGAPEVTILTVNVTDGCLKELVLPDLPEASITVVAKDIGKIDARLLSTEAVLGIEGDVDELVMPEIAFLRLAEYTDLSFLPSVHLENLTLETAVPLSSIPQVDATRLSLEGPGWSLDGISEIGHIENLSVHTKESVDYSTFQGMSLTGLILSSPLDIAQLTCLNELKTLQVWDDRISGIEALKDIPSLQTLMLWVDDKPENRNNSSITSDNIQEIDSLRLCIEKQPLIDFVNRGGTLFLIPDQWR